MRRYPQVLSTSRAVRQYNYTLTGDKTDFAVFFLRRLQAGNLTVSSLVNLPVIQCRNKFYYGVFPGLFTGVVGGGGDVRRDHDVLRWAIVKARTAPPGDSPYDVNSDGIGGLVDGAPMYKRSKEERKALFEKDPAFLSDEEAAALAPSSEWAPDPHLSLNDLAMLPASRLHHALRRPLRFRWATEVKYLGPQPYFSLEALRGLQEALGEVPSALVKSLTIYNVLLVHAALHAADPKLIRPNPRLSYKVRPLEERPKVNGRRPRGRSWEPWEDTVLTWYLNALGRTRLKAGRDGDRAEHITTLAEYNQRKAAGELLADEKVLAAPSGSSTPRSASRLSCPSAPGTASERASAPSTSR